MYMPVYLKYVLFLLSVVLQPPFSECGDFRDVPQCLCTVCLFSQELSLRSLQLILIVKEKLRCFKRVLTWITVHTETIIAELSEWLQECRVIHRINCPHSSPRTEYKGCFLSSQIKLYTPIFRVMVHSSLGKVLFLCWKFLLKVLLLFPFI